MVERTNITDFTEGRVTKKLIIFASPLFLSNLLQIVYNAVDMIIVGRVMGKVGLSAVSIGGDVCNLLTFIAMGFGNAGQVLISQYIGAGRKDRIVPFISTMFTFLMITAIALSSVCLGLRTPILHAMNTPAESYSQALSYASVCMIGLVFIYGYNFVSAVLRGMGDSMRPFIFISIAAVTNIFLDILFVAVLGYGSGGAAAATVMSQALSFICCSVYIFTHKSKYDLDISMGKIFHINFGMLRNLVALGLPMAIKNASIQFSKLFVNSWINSYGIAVSAFAGIANKINSTTNLFSNAFNTAGSSMVGQNIGAGKYDRVKKVMMSVFSLTFIVAVSLTLLMLTNARTVYGFFTSDEEVISIGMTFVPIAVMLFFSSCARAGMNALINGSGNYKVNFVTAILDGIIFRIGFSVLFGLGFGMKHIGFWLGDAIAGYTPFFIGLFFYLSGRWKKSVG